MDSYRCCYKELIKSYTILYKKIEGFNLDYFYRMLLLELKGEFSFSETLRVEEIIWCSLPSDYYNEEYALSFYYDLLQGG